MSEIKARRGGNVRNSHCNHPNKLRRQEAAKARQEISDKLTPKERLFILDKTFGKGKGAAKERAKLLAKMNKAA